ncbi:MAG: LLM class flavin-dependent oxidoreductase [Desulfobacterales bacterium]|nr:LLM class flavin-dependent oxidoreductase [Desulfobacterales bacterium]
MSKNDIRFGASLPWITPGDTFRANEILSVAKAGEKIGFDSLWSGDHLLHFPGLRVPEAWTILTASSMVTKKVNLGTAVTCPHRHHPAVFAQRLATIDHFSKGRIILGLGAGDAINLDPFNIDWHKPVSKLVEYVEIMRKLWAGERFSYESEFWSFDDAFLQIKPVGDKIPIYFAANSPRMTRFTGKIGDGWIPLGLTPELYKKRLEVIREAARMAGRNPDEIDVGIYICTSIADKAEDAYPYLEPAKSILVPSTLKEAGYELDLPENLRSYSYMDWKPTAEYMGVVAEYSKHIPTEAVNDFCLAGTVRDCINRMEAFVDAGVRHFIFEIMGPDHQKMVEQIGNEILPYFAE